MYLRTSYALTSNYIYILPLLISQNQETAVALLGRHEEVQMTPHTDGSTDLLAPPQKGDSKVGAMLSHKS